MLPQMLLIFIMFHFCFLIKTQDSLTVLMFNQHFLNIDQVLRLVYFLSCYCLQFLLIGACYYYICMCTFLHGRMTECLER